MPYLALKFPNSPTYLNLFRLTEELPNIKCHVFFNANFYRPSHKRVIKTEVKRTVVHSLTKTFQLTKFNCACGKIYVANGVNNWNMFVVAKELYGNNGCLTWTDWVENKQYCFGVWMGLFPVMHFLFIFVTSKIKMINVTRKL